MILLTFLIRDTVVAVPLQPVVNCCAEVFILVNYLCLVIVDDSIRLGWRVFPKISTRFWFLLRKYIPYNNILSIHQIKQN